MCVLEGADYLLRLSSLQLFEQPSTVLKCSVLFPTMHLRLSHCYFVPHILVLCTLINTDETKDSLI